MAKTSDELLSERIVKEIEAKKLLSKESSEKLKAKYLNGKVTAEEWSLLVELTQGEEAKNA